MKRLTSVSFAIFLAFLSAPALAQNYCNNPLPPCDTNDRASQCYKPPDPPPKCEPKECDKCTKSPCYVGSGVYEYDEKDLEIATTGFPITVSRLYQSSHTIDGESGYGWISSLSAHLYYAVFLKAAPNTYQREADIRLPNGKLYRFVENGNGSYTPPEGRFDTLVRNADGTWDLQLQRTRSHYHFAATGELLEMVDDFGNMQVWTYGKDDRLSQVEDRSGSGRYIDITWGADGRISDVTDLTKRNVNYQYDTRGVMVSATNPASQTTNYSYVNGKYVPLLNGVSDPWGRNLTTVTYDAQDRTVSYTDRGETWTYTYNYTGNPLKTSKRDSAGNTWVHTFGTDGLVGNSAAPGGGAVAHTYYANGLPQLQTDAAGVKTYYTYDARGNPLTLTQDYQGATSVEWRFTYDPAFPDHVLSVKPYNPSTNQIHPDWQGLKFDYHPPGSVAPGALHHAYTLDNDGTTARVAATYTYDSQGRVLTEQRPGASVVTYTWDASGNLLSMTSPSNNDTETLPVMTYTYDDLGRLMTVTDPEGHVTSFEWDELDRLKATTLPSPSPSSPLTFTTTYFHDEFDSATQLLFVRTVDPNGRESRIGSDQYGQAIQSVDPLGGTVRSTYTKGRMTSRIDENGNVRTYLHDSLGRPSTITHSDGTTDQYTYNADGTFASHRDRAGRTTSFTYDRHKRLLTKTYPTGGVITQTWQGQKLVQVSDSFASPPETHTYTWDGRFRVSSNTQSTRGTVSYTYTDENRIATMSVAGGAVTSYGYYPDGSPRTVTWSPVAGTFRYQYTLSGRIRSIAFPNGQTRTFTWDDQGRLTALSNSHPSTGTIAAFTYGYDVDPFSGQASLLGLRTSVSATVPALGLTNAVTQFGYNGRYELSQAVYPPGGPYNGLSAAWTYDTAGNRLTATENGSTSAYAYDKFAGNPLNSPRLHSDGSNTYAYDAKGNVISRSGSRGNFAFSYDDENRLRSITGDETADYRYDHSGRRVGATVSGASTAWLYDGDEPIAESGASAAEYLYGPGIDQPLAMLRGGEVYYYAIDGVDSVVGLNDSAGVVRNAYAWDAWGVLRGQSQTVASPFGYTARNPSQAGLQYSRFRHYDPPAGRFASEDPLQEWVPIVGSDLYAYVNSSPMMHKDPYGLECYALYDEGPWHPTGEYAMGESLEFQFMRSFPWIRMIPIGGRRIPVPDVIYYCYWQKFLIVTTYLKRTVTITVTCTCPRTVNVQSYEETSQSTEKRYIGTYMVATAHYPCLGQKPNT